MTTATAAPTTPADAQEEFEAVLPEGMSAEDFLAAADARETPADPAEPAVPAVPATPATPAPDATKLVPVGAVIRERVKRQRLAEDYSRLMADNDALQRQQVQGQAIIWSDAEKAEIKEKANKAADMGEVAEIVMDAFQKKTHTADRSRAIQERTTALAKREEEFRKEHPDYDEKLTKSGIFSATSIDPATNRYRNPAIAKDIYTAADPIARSYELALGALEQRGELEEPAESVPAEPSAAPSAPKPAPTAAAPAPKPAPSVPAAPSERPVHPRGVNVLPRTGAGPQRVGFTRQALDRMMDEDPDRYLALMNANPRLDRFHMGGADVSDDA